MSKYYIGGCFVVMLLASCGGGGGGGSSGGGSTTPTGPVTSTLSFPLKAGLTNSIINNPSTYFNISGTCSGTASNSGLAPITATFEGVSGISEVTTQTISLSNCTPASTIGFSTDYFDINYVPLGSTFSDGTYSVFPTPPSIPTSVKVGDTGTLGTSNNYLNSTKTVLTGTDAISYVIEPDTATTAIVNKIDKSFNSLGVLTSTEQDRFRIAADGTLTPVSTDIQAANGSTTHLVLTALPATTPTVIVSTLAGSGSAGNIDGTGTAASFNLPRGVAVDGSGNVYVADGNNNAIRKITPAGVVSTLASSFSNPIGVAVDSSGNVYVADSGNNEIRKITPAGVVSTLAGTGFQGNANGIGPLASFYFPRGVAVDSSGNVYVSDSNNNEIRKITPGGLVSTLAGSGSAGNSDGSGTAASFSDPYGIAVDSSGNVYVADSNNSEIRKITSTGVVSTFAGSTNNPNNIINSPSGIAVDSSGNVYVATVGNRLILTITPAGVISTLAGTGNAGNTNGAGSVATFDPVGVAVDSGGNVYVGEPVNQDIRKITVIP